MTVRHVSSPTYPDIAAAVAVSSAGDTVKLTPGYSNDSATVTVDNMIVTGGGQSANIDLQLGLGVADLTLGGYARIDVMDNSGANVITGNSGANTIEVSGGADVVHGGGGVDRMFADYGSATATVTGTVTSITDGGANSVTYDGIENVTLYTGSGNDTVTLADGDNRVKSAGGNDTITVGDGHNNVASGTGNDTVTAGDGGNKVNGGGGDNTITTGAGHDVVLTGGGNDTVITGGGADVTHVTGGADSVDSGTGNDQLTVNYHSAISNVTGGPVSGDLAGGYTGVFADANGNSVNFSNTENFAVTTGTGDDHISTGAGHDLLSGGAGNDYLSAGDGADRLIGGSGADVLIGGGGADVMTGGAGADHFDFSSLSDSQAGSMDLIRDLHNNDVIDLSQIDADSGQAGDQAFTLVGQFTDHAGQATFHYDAGANQTILSLDVNGDGVADFSMAATGDHSHFHGFVL